MLQLATSADRDAVNRLAQQVHKLHAAWRPDIFEMVPELFDESRFAELLQQRQLYVAKLSGEVLGFVLLKIRDYDWPGVVRRKVMVIDQVCVEESCRGNGIGTEIMGDVRALARAFRCTDLQLGVYPQNEEAIAFYQKCGFTIRSIDMQCKL